MTDMVEEIVGLKRDNVRLRKWLEFIVERLPAAKPSPTEFAVKGYVTAALKGLPHPGEEPPPLTPAKMPYESPTMVKISPEVGGGGPLRLNIKMEPGA